MKKIITTITLLTALNAQESYTDKLIRYHQSVSEWLTQNIDYIDRYLSGTNSKKPNHSQVDISFTLIPGSDGSFDTDYGFSLNLDMPRFSNRLHLLFNQIEDNWKGTKGSTPPQLHNDIYDKSREKNYNFGFKYNKIQTDKLSFDLTGGVRFSKNFFEPYIGLIVTKNLLRKNKTTIDFTNEAKLYIGGELQNVSTLERVYNIDEKSLFSSSLSLGYSSNSNDQSLLLSSNYFYAIDNNRYINSGALISSTLTQFKSPKANQYKIFTQYRDNLLHKKWLYYKVTPSVQWKRENNFHASYHLGITLGMKFGKN